MGRTLGLDVGDKRIGIAVSDLLNITAQGLPTYTRTQNEGDASYFCNLIKEQNVTKIVCGLPKNMDGSEGFQAQKVRDFALELENISGLKVIFWDERLTTKSAKATLHQLETKRKKVKENIDKIAAVYILQGYMDSIL